MLTLKELRTLKRKELLDELRSAKKNLDQLRIAIKTKHEKDTSKLRKQKKYVAHIKTVIRELELEEAVKEAAKVD